MWDYLDIGSGRNFISREAIEKMNLKPARHESRQIVTINGVQKQSLPIFEVRLDSLDDKTSDQVEVTGSKMAHFTAVRRPSVKEWKQNTNMPVTSNFTWQQMSSILYT